MGAQDGSFLGCLHQKLQHFFVEVTLKAFFNECNCLSGKLAALTESRIVLHLFQDNQYKYLGQFTVMSITRGGCRFPFLAQPVYDYITTGKLSRDIQVEMMDIPDPTLQFILRKVTFTYIIII